MSVSLNVLAKCSRAFSNYQLIEGGRWSMFLPFFKGTILARVPDKHVTTGNIQGIWVGWWGEWEMEREKGKEREILKEN